MGAEKASALKTHAILLFCVLHLETGNCRRRRDVAESPFYSEEKTASPPKLPIEGKEGQRRSFSDVPSTVEILAFKKSTASPISTVNTTGENGIDNETTTISGQIIEIPDGTGDSDSAEVTGEELKEMFSDRFSGKRRRTTTRPGKYQATTIDYVGQRSKHPYKKKFIASMSYMI